MFDLHTNKMLYICSKNRYGIDPVMKSELGLSEFEIKKQMTKGMKQFIAYLRLPTYKHIQYYNFYDVLDALSKNLFVNDFNNRKIVIMSKEDHQ